MTTIDRPHFLADVEPDAAGRAMFDVDVDDVGYVMNATRLWAYQAETHDGLFDLLGATTKAGGLTLRQRGILVTSCASTLGDSYCSLAWGTKLAAEADADMAAGVLLADDNELTDAERVLADWARKVTTDPNRTTVDDVDVLRTAGFSDEQVFAITVYVALRIAFSTVNDALGARPDGAYRTTAPPRVLAAVTYGRPIAD
ncbi:hypothetical protein BH23ACT5_BH23ACT5_19760 [soil metagenome]